MSSAVLSGLFSQASRRFASDTFWSQIASSKSNTSRAPERATARSNQAVPSWSASRWTKTMS